MKRKIIENYALIEVIGQGMYGTVYKATHLQSNEEFAVKVIPILKFQQNPKLQECTVNEINILSRIQNSTHIIKYIEMLKTPNNFYFVYEFCNGGTLEHRLKNQSKLSEKEALKIFRQLLEAFKILNGYNIMHRDLKPDNIFFDNGVLKLGDFGFCKTLGKANDMASTMLGSPIYMAPEVLKGEAYSSRADIWSLGVVLYEMLFGYCPFQSNSIAKLITVLADTQLKIPLEITPISNMTQVLLKKILVKDQFKRIDWFDLLNFNISEDGTITEASSTALEQLRLTSSQRSIDEYVRKHSDQSPSMATNPNELMFKKKNQPYSRSNTELNKNPKAKVYEPQDAYSVGASNSPQKSNFSQEVKNEPSAYSPANQMKRVPSPDQIVSKRRFLLEQHSTCINAVKTAMGFLRAENANGLVFALLLFKKTQQKLKRISDSIVYSETENQDISGTVTNELKHIEKQISDITNQIRIHGFDASQIESPKQMLRQRYSNKQQFNPKLWYELVTFLNEGKINQRATQSEWETTVDLFIR